MRSSTPLVFVMSGKVIGTASQTQLSDGSDAAVVVTNLAPEHGSLCHQRDTLRCADAKKALAE